MKKSIIILVSVFLINLVSAVSVQFPYMQVFSNNPQSYSLTITNNYTFSIFNFTFSNLSGFVFPEMVVQPNSTQTFQFTALSTKVGNNTINSKVSFKYLVNIPQGLNTFQVNITPTGGFQPSNLIVRRGDTVIWNNLDSISRGVTGNNFDFNILPNQTASQTFNSVGSYDYQDLVLFFGGNIQVINETESTPINNPSYDFYVPINLVVFTNPTNVSISLNQDTYSINATDLSSGFLVLTNTGSSVAQNIHLSSDKGWFNFEKNDFNLNPSNSISVNYRIQPLIYQSTDTNITHKVTLQVTGENFNEIDKLVSIFVPYNANFADLTTFEGQMALFTRICGNPQYKNTLFCNNTILGSGNGSNIVQDANFNMNMTASQWLAFLKRQQTQTDTIARQGNELVELKALQAQLLNTLNETNSLNNLSLSKQVTNETTSNTWQFIFIISLFFGGVLWITAYLIKQNKTSNLQKSLRDGGIEVT